jgi:uncharacterized protein YcfJ
MPEQDAVAQWKAFSPEQRQTALAKMTSEQKNILKTKIESVGKPQTPNPVGNTGVSMGSTSGPMPAHKQQFEAPMRERVAAGASSALPMVGATMGAVAGGPIGAGVGAMAGTAAQQGIDKGKVDPKSVAVSGAENAALEYVGGKLAPKALATIAKKAGPRATEIVNNYLGLNKGMLPKFGRTVQNAKEIAQTVLDKVGIKPNLEAQRAAIETTRAAYDDATKKIVAAPGGKLMDVHSALYDRAVKLLGEAEKEGVPQEQLRAIDKNLQSTLDATKKDMMNPQEIHDLRKNIQGQITDWSPNTLNIRQRFLQGVYHDLNDAITRSLPPKEARQFLANNRIQSKLITARTAADSTLLKTELKSKPGLATSAARLAGRTATGAVVGGVAGGEMGHGKEGALLGAAAGAVSGKVGEINLPAMDVKATRALAASASKLAKVSKATPQVVRTLNAIHAVQSRPQQ